MPRSRTGVPTRLRNAMDSSRSKHMLIWISECNMHTGTKCDMRILHCAVCRANKCVPSIKAELDKAEQEVGSKLSDPESWKVSAHAPGQAMLCTTQPQQHHHSLQIIVCNVRRRVAQASLLLLDKHHNLLRPLRLIICVQPQHVYALLPDQHIFLYICE